ncbi:hypothetical protein [Marinovum sp.]|uniref:hypothetical protein n=1 Tax=Marinovum sp. TaxID=2024839 RepID=UPI002B265660|nr:hypothetical protein [Marinovum sp.]
MTNMTYPRLGLVILGLSLAACSEYRPAKANCFEPAEGGRATAHVSTQGAVVERGDKGCQFQRLTPAN